MGLTKCPDCEKEVSELARKCPNCARPLVPNNAGSLFAKSDDKKVQFREDKTIDFTNIYKTGRILIGVLSIIGFAFMTLEPFLFNIVNYESKETFNEGSLMILLSLLMLIGGIVTLCLGNKHAKKAYIIPGSLYLSGALCGASQMKDHSTILKWCIVLLMFSLLHFYFLFKTYNYNKIITYIVPILIFVFVLGFAGSNKKEDELDGRVSKLNNAQKYVYVLHKEGILWHL